VLQALPIAQGDGRSPKLLAAFAQTERLLLDDWGLAPCSAEPRRDILARLEERHGRRATMIPRQFPVDHWPEAMGHPTLADAILDRVLHNASKIALRGESRRKRQIPMPNAMNAL
jgi:DNA replication protein DnaC